jgi:hypothetical protein
MEHQMFDQTQWKGSTGAVLGDQLFVPMEFDFSDRSKFDGKVTDLVKMLRKALDAT